jgi:mannose-1-phosphate guanylyltransferase
MYFAILAGGTGKRFWPISRKKLPKQFIRIIDERTMLEHTIDRILPLAEKGKIYIITSIEHRNVIENLLDKKYADLSIKVIYEPFPRDTAPAVGLINEMIYREDKDALVVSLHSDHYIEKEAEFREILRSGVERARMANDIVLIGIKPTYPATGFGYIEMGEQADNINNQTINKVISFKEKPDEELANKYLKKGNYLWNSGIFIWSVDRILNEISKHEPQLYQGLKNIDTSNPVKYAATFTEFKKQAIDKAVLEKTDRISVITSDIGWNDVGSYNSVYDIKKEKDGDNIFEGKVKAINAKSCFVKTQGDKLFSLIGVEDIILIETEDAVMVTKKSEVQKIKDFYDILEKEGDYEGYL